MDFTVPDKMQAILGLIREFMQKEVYPLEREFVARPIDEVWPEVMARRELVKRMELWAPQLPRDVGGMGLSVLEHALVSEELGRSPLGHIIFGCNAPDAGNLEILHKYASPEQRERWLLPLARGDIRSCFAMTEPELAGSNPTALGTTAVKDGDSWVVSGHKWFSTGADGSAFAIVMAITNPQAGPYQRASMIIVPTGTPGYNLVRNIPVMGHAGGGVHSHGEILFQSCRVPLANLLGPEGLGFMIAQERLGPGRIHHTMRWIGICERSFDLMCRRAASREVGEGKTLASKQIVQGWIAELRARINAARLMVLHAAWVIDTRGTYEAREEISLIKYFVADVMMDVIDRAIQVHGGLGVTDDTPLAFFWRFERAARIYDGADEVHKVVVARRILRAYQEGAR